VDARHKAGHDERMKTSMKVKANGIAINYQVDGPERAPWLVFSNSLATSLAMWDEQAAALKDRFRVLRYDQRGHGETEAPAGRYAFDTLLDDALALMDALGIAKATFAGLSMGGATALGLAERHPERFERIIVADSPCQSTPQSSQQWEERIAVAQNQGIEALVEPTVARWFPPETVAKNPPYLDKIRAMMRATPVNGFIGCAAALAAHDYASAVAMVKCPTLFVVGEKDGATPAAMAKLHEKLHDKLAGSRFVMLPGAGHISNMDRGGEFNRALRDFLN
jgi:3-oxoadipate enol-lactonase